MTIFNRTKEYIVPLIFVFLFSLCKAESFDSAFCLVDDIQEKETSLIHKKLFLAEKLFKSKDYTQSLKYCYSITEETDDVTLLLRVNLLIANIFKETEYFVESKKYYKKVLRLLGNSAFLSKERNLLNENFEEIKTETFLRLGSLYSKSQKNNDSAIYYFNEVLDVGSLSEKVLRFKGDAYNNLSAIYFYGNVKKDFIKAESYVKKAIELHEKLNEKQSLAADYGNLASIYAEKLNHERAKELYLKALSYIEDETSTEAINYKETLYDNLAWTLYNLRDYKAYDYLDMSYEIKDSIKTEKFKTEIKKVDLKYNIDKIRQEEENKRLEVERNSWVIGVIGVVVSLLFLYLANLYKLRQKNLSLKLSKSELEQQRKLDELKSESQVKIINATLDGKESERKQIAETLHDNVSALLSSANMHLQASEKQFDGELPIELQKTQQIILEASQKIRDLSHHLVSSILLKFGLEYAVKDVAKKYSNSQIKIHAVASNVHRYSQESEIKIFNIIQELINNVLKHSKAKNAYVMMEKETGILSIIVKDDGLGFDTKKIDGGIGLNQIQARIHMMDGDFDVKTSKEGTKITINIPVKERDEVNFV